jgi:AbrB family looped-hinge helix DNA binding protein
MSTCALPKCLTTSYLEILLHGIRNMDTTKLSSKGQVVLPKSVRDQHGWGEGTEFVVESTAHGVLLRRVFGSLPYRGKPKSLSDFDAGIRREIRRRHGRN